MLGVVDGHREILTDDARLRAFEAALQEVIKPEHVVLDLAAGTGILGLLAIRAGARRVYSVDDGAILQVAREIGRANQFADRIQYVRGFSTRLDLPEKVDVVVADQTGPFGFEAGVVSFFDDARARLLKPGGITVPATVDLHIAPVVAPDIARHIAFWKSPVLGFDMTPAHRIALNSAFPITLRHDQLLGAPETLCCLNLAAPAPTCVRAEATLKVEHRGTLHGIGGWFSAQLSEHVTMTNSPLAEPAIRRRNMVFPIATPVDVQQDDRIRVVMDIIASEVIVSWRVDIAGPTGEPKGEVTHSTWRETLRWSEDLEKMRSNSITRLSPWGAVHRSVLELCNGGRSVSAIEEEVYSRHPELFRSEADVARFVSEILIQSSV